MSKFVAMTSPCQVEYVCVYVYVYVVKDSVRDVKPGEGETEMGEVNDERERMCVSGKEDKERLDKGMQQSAKRKNEGKGFAEESESQQKCCRVEGKNEKDGEGQKLQDTEYG